jgi:hypothetical protein
MHVPTIGFLCELRRKSEMNHFLASDDKYRDPIYDDDYCSHRVNKKKLTERLPFWQDTWKTRLDPWTRRFKSRQRLLEEYDRGDGQFEAAADGARTRTSWHSLRSVERQPGGAQAPASGTFARVEISRARRFRFTFSGASHATAICQRIRSGLPSAPRRQLFGDVSGPVLGRAGQEISPGTTLHAWSRTEMARKTLSPTCTICWRFLSWWSNRIDCRFSVCYVAAGCL